MGNTVVLNGNTFKEKNGQVYLNGNLVERNVVTITHTVPVWPDKAAFFIWGFMCCMALVNIFGQ